MLKIISGDMAKADTGCLVILVCEDKEIYSNPLIARLIQRARQIDEFKAKQKDELFLYDLDEIKAQRVLFMGIGKHDKIDRETLRSAAGRSVARCMKRSLSEMILCVPELSINHLNRESILESLAEGACLSNYIFDRYKKEKKQKPLKQIVFNMTGKPRDVDLDLVSDAETICMGTLLARDWVNMPSNDKRPERFVRSILDAAKKEQINIAVLDEKMLQKQNMGGILAVGSGSKSRPKMIVLDYNPAKGRKRKERAKTIALVGKGVTFDSGGINLKPSEGLSDMKLDMSGAASVAATLIVVSRLKKNCRVVGLMPVVENMPSGDAARPGDIVTAYSGKTVEIGNTDAEGRLILMDAMSYAVKIFKPDFMIDLATLTGACMIALGEKIAGVFSTDKELSDAIISSGEKTYERCWSLPMPDDYREMIRSDFADIKNIGRNRYGGAIIGALFLSEFVSNTAWAHIDIAGPAYSGKASDYCSAGATGFGVRLIMDLIQKLQPSE